MADRSPLVLPLTPTTANSNTSSVSNFPFTPPQGRFFAATPTSNPTPPRSLFNLTPAPLVSPSSLFTVSSSSTTPHTSGALDSARISSQMTPGNPQLAPFSFSTPNTLTTPPSRPLTISSVPKTPSAPRTIPQAQRQLQITPSPFRPVSSQTPNFEMPSRNTELPFAPAQHPPTQIESHAMQGHTPTARVLQFEEENEVPSGARQKRSLPLTSPNTEAEQAQPPPKRPIGPFLPIQPMTTPLPRVQPTTIGHILQPALSPSPMPSTQFPSKQPMTPSSSAENRVVESPRSPRLDVRHELAVPPPFTISSSPAIGAGQEIPRSAPIMSPTRNSSVGPLALRPMMDVTPSVTLSRNSSYSSYNAALAAQALLEDVPEDRISVNDSRDSFVIETGAIASALESLVSCVTETADRVNMLNLNLQLANNEILLMNSSIVVDDRLRNLEEYFSRIGDD